jgi:L-serine/L-threonine ammonia-lyase
VVSDRAAVPAWGASLAVVYDIAPELEQFKSVLVVVCGGVNTSIEKLGEWSYEFA